MQGIRRLEAQFLQGDRTIPDGLCQLQDILFIGQKKLNSSLAVDLRYGPYLDLGNS